METIDTFDGADLDRGVYGTGRLGQRIVFRAPAKPESAVGACSVQLVEPRTAANSVINFLVQQEQLGGGSESVYIFISFSLLNSLRILAFKIQKKRTTFFVFTPSDNELLSCPLGGRGCRCSSAVDCKGNLACVPLYSSIQQFCADDWFYGSHNLYFYEGRAIDRTDKVTCSTFFECDKCVRIIG